MRFLDALSGRNQGRPPIWLMRQAGRYSPSYQAIRKNHPLRELFFTPELIKTITLLPIQELDVDAAILFSDITVIVKALGLSLDFSEGPVIGSGPLSPKPVEKVLAPIADAIRMLRKEATVPLIGFCGGPYTVAYFMKQEITPSLLQSLTEATLDYIDLQIDAGVDAFQIFDSRSHQLNSLHPLCLPYHEQLIRKVQSRGIPVISFFSSASEHLEEIAAVKPTVISVDPLQPLAEIRKKTNCVLQGNFDPDLLFAPLGTIEEKALCLLDSMNNDPGFIFNLGGGIKPKTSWEAVERLIRTVKEYDVDRILQKNN